MSPDAKDQVLAQASAPAKVILIGEHAVVYGRPAIALPLPQLHARAEVLPGAGSLVIESRYPGADGLRETRVDLAEEGPPQALAVAARAALRHAGRTERTPWRLRVESEIPTGRGLGSSAAVAVALVRALGLAAEPDEAWDPQTVAELALEAERFVHGQASGIDPAVSAYQRPIHFQEGRARPLAVGADTHFLVADSGQHKGTAEMVAGLRARQAERPLTHGAWFDKVGRLAEDAVRALAEGSFRWLGQLMDSNHLLLQAMELSTPALDNLVAGARGAGARGAKLTGSGGGGAVIALVDTDRQADVAQALREAGAVSVLQLCIPATG